MTMIKFTGGGAPENSSLRGIAPGCVSICNCNRPTEAWQSHCHWGNKETGEQTGFFARRAQNDVPASVGQPGKATVPSQNDAHSLRHSSQSSRHPVLDTGSVSNDVGINTGFFARRAQNDVPASVGQPGKATVPSQNDAHSLRHPEFISGSQGRNDAPAKVAFTLAEVLITLGIIGIVAAMTLPALIGRYQKNVTVTKLQKAYTTINQALKMSEVDNESMKYWEEPDDSGDNHSQIFEKYFKPYLKIGKKCNNLRACPFKKNSFCTPKGSPCGTYAANNIQSYILNDGTYIKLFGSLSVIKSFDGVDSAGHPKYTYKSIKNSLIIDINGIKGPGIYGKDVFVFYYEEGLLKPYVSLPFNIFNRDYSDYYCNNGPDLNGMQATSCASKIIRDGWKIKDDYPW